MKRYPEYKESGMGWIGEIPRHWEVVRNKHLFGNRNQRGSEGEPLLSVTQDQGILPRSELDYRVWNPDGNVRLYKLVRPGDWVISLRTFEGGIELSEVRGIVSAAYTTMFPRRQIFNSYFKYLLKSMNFIAELNRITTGIRQGKNISYEDFSDTRIAFPPLSEQKVIGNFLDHKTGQIDELIRIKERRIELLQEQRTALINQAVTKGLDPNVEMKPSGVEWIGGIPKHWTIIKLRYLGVLQNGISKDSDSFGLGYPFLSYGDVYNNETLPTQVEGLVKSTKANRERYAVKETDVFFTRTSETIEEIGISSTCMKTIENCVFSGFVIRFRNTSKILTKEFSKYYFPSHLPRIFLAREVNIVTRSSLSQELLKRLPVLLPPPDEQKEITMFLDEQTQKIDSMIEKENKQIELLKEYRQSLISEAVTGKIDVRNEV